MTATKSEATNGKAKAPDLEAIAAAAAVEAVKAATTTDQKATGAAIGALSDVLKQCVGAMKEAQLHVERLVKLSTAPAEIVAGLVTRYERICDGQQDEIENLRKELREQAELVEKARQEAWEREMYQIEFAQKAELREKLFEFAKEHAPAFLVNKSKRKLDAVVELLDELGEEKLAMLKAVLTAEQWALVEELREERKAKAEASKDAAATETTATEPK